MAVETAKINIRYTIYYGKYLAHKCIYIPSDLCLGDIPGFRHFVCVRQQVDADCVISIEYNSELPNHVSKS